MDLTRLDQIQREKAQNESDVKKRAEIKGDSLDLQETIVKSFKALVDYLEGSTSKTLVVNQLKEIGTPDVKKVVEAVESLHETQKKYENVDLTEITSVMKNVLAEAKKIPKDHAKTEKQQFIDYSKQFKSMETTIKAVEKAVKAQETNVEAPVVNVDAPNVKVDAPDLKPLTAKLDKSFAKAIKGIIYPTIPKTDMTPVVKEQKKTNKLLNEMLDSPMGGSSGGTKVYETNASGQIEVDVVSSVAALAITNAIDSTAYDLNNAAFSESSSISNDYILNSIKMNFSTTESKTITVTGPDGTVIYKDTNTSQDVSLGDMNIAFNANDNFTVAVTQFVSTGTMDCVAVIQQGTPPLTGNPVLGSGNEIVGQVKITDGTDTLDIIGDGDTIDLEDEDGTVGTSKGTLIFAKDSENKSRTLNTSGKDNEFLKVQNQDSYILKDILVQLKILVKHQEIITEIEFKERNL